VVIRGLGAPALVYRGGGTHTPFAWPRSGCSSCSRGAARRSAGCAAMAATSASRRSTCGRPRLPGWPCSSRWSSPGWWPSPGAERQPYGWLLAIGGLAYLLAVAWFRWRGW